MKEWLKKELGVDTFFEGIQILALPIFGTIIGCLLYVGIVAAGMAAAYYLK